MKISISEDLKRINPDLALGVIEAEVVVEKHSSDLWKEIEQELKKVKEGHSLEGLVHLPEIASVRNTYKKLGKDPGRYRGSAEALLRRIVQGKGLYKVNNVVDINNMVSIETRHPVGSYNRENITGDIVFGIGEKGEMYKGIGKEMINIAELPVFKDERGPYGSPTSDSERAMVTQDTRHILMIIISCMGPKLEDGMDRAVELLRKYATAEILNTSIIS